MKFSSYYGDAIERMISHLSDGKGYDKTEKGRPDNWRDVAEAEIDAMSNGELIMLMESAGLFAAPPSCCLAAPS
jgi:hypothetical protein